MTHAPVFNGDGHYCPRCNQSWDQGDPQPADCHGGAVVSLGPPPDAAPRNWIAEQLSTLATTLKEISPTPARAVDTL